MRYASSSVNCIGGCFMKQAEGAYKTPYDTRPIKPGDKFVFKDVFHDDHVIPIKHIIGRLLALENPNHDNVTEIIRHISICRMLKKEDRSITRKWNRPFSEKEIINTIYAQVGIELADNNM